PPFDPGRLWFRLRPAPRCPVHPPPLVLPPLPLGSVPLQGLAPEAPARRPPPGPFVRPRVSRRDGGRPGAVPDGSRLLSDRLHGQPDSPRDEQAPGLPARGRRDGRV